ncbi:MAG: hypothetical protein LBJ15_04470 [Comamonas sp.]|jgi:hypothetical protein|uniref:hypothetical protein n=1 Tax=Comamonas sp. TaxID=34028 RepID=UPI002824A7ED|nr:hypothetical protein [Comamonas sp.]MDR0213242.1 hypothetical protein [Comamonas sp.]
MLLIIKFIALFVLGVIVLAEALNKLERTRPCAPGITPHQRLLAWLKAVAWLLLAMAGAGALAGPFVGHHAPSLRELCMFAGFAVLIIRTRFKEG